jgi:hypothetical protein
MMGHNKTLIKQSAVARVTRGLLMGAAAAGLAGDVEVNLETAVVKLHIRGKLEGAAAVALAENEANEWDSVQ